MKAGPFTCVSCMNTLVLTIAVCAMPDGWSGEPPPIVLRVDKIFGKDVAAWIKHLNAHETPEERHMAIYCLGDFGPLGAPAVQVLRKEAVESSDLESRRLAIEALGLIGRPSSGALKDLLKILADEKAAPRIRRACCEAVVRIAPGEKDVVRAMQKAMKNREARLRHAAINATVSLFKTEKAEEVLKQLERAASRPEDAEPAATALLCLGGKGIPALTNALKKAGNQTARLAILDALRRLGPRASPARETVLEIARGGAFWRKTSQEARATALRVLAAISLADPEHLSLIAATLGDEALTQTSEQLLARSGNAAIGVLKKPLGSRQPEKQAAALRVLRQLGTPAADLLDEARELLGSKDRAVVRAAAELMKDLGTSAADAEADLKRAAARWKEDRTLQHVILLAALNVARPAGTSPQRSIMASLSTDDLCATLNGNDAARRREAAALLRSRTNTDAKKQIADALIKSLKDKDTGVRASAAKSLAFYGPAGREAIPVLLEWLNGAEKELHAPALAALSGMNVQDQTAMVTLVAFAKRAASELEDTAKFLGPALRAQGTAATRWLIEGLKDPDAKVRRRSAIAIQGMGAVGLTALPDLMKLAQSDPDSVVAQAALQAIAAFGPPARAATPHLVDLLGHRDVIRRMAAGWALAGVGIEDPEKDKHHVIHSLIMNLLDPKESAARAAHSALVKIGKPVLPRVRELLKVGTGEGPYWALRVLARLKADPDEVIPRMLQLTLPGKLPIERGVAAELLGNYAPKHTEMIPTLVGVLGDRKDYVVNASARTLKLFGDKAIPALEAVLRSPDPRQRKNALQLIEEIRERR